MRGAVEKLWPEIQWIEDSKLREQVTQTWIKVKAGLLDQQEAEMFASCRRHN